MVMVLMVGLSKEQEGLRRSVDVAKSGEVKKSVRCIRALGR